MRRPQLKRIGQRERKTERKVKERQKERKRTNVAKIKITKEREGTKR